MRAPSYTSSLISDLQLTIVKACGGKTKERTSRDAYEAFVGGYDDRYSDAVDRCFCSIAHSLGLLLLALIDGWV